MGYIRHHAIIVSSWSEEHIYAAHEEASKLFSWVSEVSQSQINGYRAFFIPPDGSKEGWAVSNEGNIRRRDFTKWLADSESYCDWIEVQFGDDNHEDAIIRSSDSGWKESRFDEE